MFLLIVFQVVQVIISPHLGIILAWCQTGTYFENLMVYSIHINVSLLITNYLWRDPH